MKDLTACFGCGHGPEHHTYHVPATVVWRGISPLFTESYPVKGRHECTAPGCSCIDFIAYPSAPRRKVGWMGLRPGEEP